MKQWVLPSLLALLLLDGCIASSPPKPAESSTFITEGAGFLIEEGTVKYGMNYGVKKKLEDPLYIVVEFENPKPGAKKIETETTLHPGEKSLQVQSPVLPGIQNDRSYSTVLKAYSDKGKTNFVTEHTQNVLFRMPEQYLRQTGVNLF